MRELQSVPQALLRVLRLPIPHPWCAPERPHSRSRGAAGLGRQRENTDQPEQNPAAVCYPSRAGANSDHLAQHRRQPGLAQPAHGECKKTQKTWKTKKVLIFFFFIIIGSRQIKSAPESGAMGW